MKKNERIYHYTISICNCINDLIIKNETISINKISEHTNLDNVLIKKILSEYIKFDMYYNSYHILKNMIKKINIYIDNKTIDLKKGFKSYKTIDMKYQTILENLNISYSNLYYFKSIYKNESIVVDLENRLELLKNKPLYFCVDCNNKLAKYDYFIINVIYICLNNIKNEYDNTGFLNINKNSLLNLNNRNDLTFSMILKKLGYNENMEFLLYLKEQNDEIITKCIEIIKYLKIVPLYKCLKCHKEITITEYNKKVCFHCIKEQNDYKNVFIECSICNEHKSLLDFPKDKKSNIIGFRIINCKKCDLKLFEELRRNLAFQYSQTEHGKQIRKSYYIKQRIKLKS